MATSLRSLEVKGLKSMAHVDLQLSSDVTLLVGSNGSGKSNIVGAFELLGRIVDGQSNDYIVRRGGIQRHLHRASDPSASASQIEMTVWGEWAGGLSNGYRALLVPAAEDRVVVSETTYFHDKARYSTPYSDHLGTSSESRLRESAAVTARNRHVLDLLSGCRVFHFDDVSQDAPPKRRVDVADNLGLHPDAGNLASVLLHMRDGHPEKYARLLRAVQTVAPYFADFVLKPNDTTLLLRWQEVGLDGVFSADALSDGTLRFVCLATLLLQPDPPRTIVLDEPELGLHPFAIHQLAHLMRSVADGRRVVAATQSVTLLEQFTVDEVAVVERGGTGTSVHRPDRERLTAWLDDYSLGDLWEKNVLGGRPGRSAVER